MATTTTMDDTTESETSIKADLQWTMHTTEDGINPNRFDVLATDDVAGVESSDHVVITLQDYSYTGPVAFHDTDRYVKGRCGNCGCNRLRETVQDHSVVFHEVKCPVCGASETMGEVQGSDGFELTVDRE